MIGYYSYTVILTYLSLVFAMAGIHLSFNGMYQWAFICLIMCGICDTFDGMVARSKKNRTDEEKRFGIQIDSLCDLVAFKFNWMASNRDFLCFSSCYKISLFQC